MISESKFQMWRGTIALVQVDNVISKEEKLWLDQHLKKIPFTSQQKTILQNDYNNGIKLDDILLSSLELRERGMLLSFANTIFKSDGLSKEEEIVLKDLTKKILGELNMVEVEKVVANTQIKFKNEEESVFRKFINLLLTKE